MNKKGFTLVELLAIIAILGIIIGVAVPNISKQIGDMDKKKESMLNRQIENAAHLYVADHLGEFQNLNILQIKLSDLTGEKLLKLGSDQCTSTTGSITVTKNYFNTYTYNYDEIGKDADCYQ